MDIDYFVAFAVSLIFAYWPFVAAIVLGLLLPAIMVILSSVSTKWPDHLKLTVIFASIVVGGALAMAFSGRTIVSEADLAANPNLLQTLTIERGNYWFSRISHLIVLSVSITEIFMWIIRKRHMGKPQFTLWAAAITYYFFSEIVSGILGQFRGFNISMLYTPIVFTAVALLVSSDFVKSLRSLRWMLLVPLLGSLLAMLVAPQLVLETGYKGLIPGLHYRLAGLTEHANSLGLLAVIAFFLEYSKFVCTKPNPFFLLISVTTLVFTQSKTAWVIVIIGFVILSLNTRWEAYRQNRKQGGSLAILSYGIALASIAVTLVVTKIDSLQNFLSADRTGLLTFTGRTRIWDITWNEFLSNPVSGYGPSIWDPLYRFQHGMLFVGQAHNQYMQTIGQAGLLGILSLAFYIYLLVRKSYQGWNETHGFSFILVTVLLIRGFSESPMRMIGILSSDSFTHLLTFATVAMLTLQAKVKQ